MRLKPGVDLSQLFLTSSLCCESCKVEVTHVNIYLITTHELCRALSSLWGRHDLHYNDTVDIFPVTLIVTSLLPVGICGLIRQLVQAIWSCDETRQEGRGWDLRGNKREWGKKGGFVEYQSIQNIYKCELIQSSPPCIHLPTCGFTNILHCRTQHPYSSPFLLLVAVVLPGIWAQASWAVKPTREPSSIVQTPSKQGWLRHPASILRLTLWHTKWCLCGVNPGDLVYVQNVCRLICWCVEAGQDLTDLKGKIKPQSAQKL